MLPDQGDATDDDGGDCDYERVETRDLVVVYMLWLFVGFTRMVLCNGRRMGVLSCRLYLFYSYIQFQFISYNSNSSKPIAPSLSRSSSFPTNKSMHTFGSHGFEVVQVLLAPVFLSGVLSVELVGELAEGLLRRQETSILVAVLENEPIYLIRSHRMYPYCRHHAPRGRCDGRTPLPPRHRSSDCAAAPARR